jgi:hypothetical protein
MRHDALIFGNRREVRQGLCLTDKRAWREDRTALAIYYAPGLDVVDLAGYCLPASDRPYGYARSFSCRDSTVNRSICFILCSGTNIQGVLGPTSLCVYAFVDYLSFSSRPLDLLGTSCRHLRTCHIWLLPDGKSAFAPAMESRRADYGRFAASNISVPT